MKPTQEGREAAFDGRLPDRLLLLQQFIPAAEVLQVLRDTGCIDQRRCTPTVEVTCWIVLAAGLLTDLPIRAVLKASTTLHGLARIGTPARSSLCEARQRLGIAAPRRLFYRFARPLATPATPGSFFHGLRLMAIDGTVLSVPDGMADARAFGRASAGPRGLAAFPQIRKVSLVEVGTHAEVAFVVKGITHKGGEQAAVPALLRYVGAGTLLLLDAGFYAYHLWRELVASQTRVLTRLSGTLKLPALQGLPDGSYLSAVYPSDYARKKGRDGIAVRVIRYTHGDPKRANCGKEHRLLTTLPDAEKYPAGELIVAYHEGWEIGLTYDEQKTHQAPRVPGKEAQLRSETPAGVVQELYALTLGHFLTRSLMAQAARTEGIDPDRLSFAGCLRVLRARLPEFAALRPGGRKDWYQAFLRELAAERTEPRRNRINPRVIKVKMSKFKKKRAQHRNIRPLTQTFEESILLL
jgi:hypothetical protein